MKIFILFLTIYPFILQGQNYLPDVCRMTFNNATVTSNPSNPNANLFVCPSACYTLRYRSNQDDYPLYGNETYSGNSLICKAAFHDGRIAPWNTLNTTVFIRNSSTQSTSFLSTLRNGILSKKSIGISYLIYQFTGNRINESSIPDVAIEHRGFIYNQDQTSSITCRGATELHPIQPLEIDQGWKRWSKSSLDYFAFPTNFTRQQSLSFCSNNNGTLMYWSDLIEQGLFQNILSSTIYRLFRSQLETYSTINFFIGMKQINQSKQWESNIISYNQTLDTFFNFTLTDNYCTMIQLINGLSQSFRVSYFNCDDTTVSGYPLCRLRPSARDEENDFIYRLETDTQRKNLVGVIDFCAELGGYPIYAYNAYEWQIVQEIMLTDSNFNDDYVYTGLLSPTKQVNNAYWLPRNISYNSSLNYIQFGPFRGNERTGFHLSRARGESYYYLYDIDPYSTLNTLRFCRKDDIRTLTSRIQSCNTRACTSNCVNMTLPNESEDARFGFYSCLPKNSLVGIIYTQAFPQQTDFPRPNLPMNYGVNLRLIPNESLSLTFNNVNQTLARNCFEYLNFDVTSPSDGTIALNCFTSTSNHFIFNGITFLRNFNGLITLAFEGRRMSGHHTRYIDYQLSDSRCRFQGIYHPYVNQCICSPGYYGTECEYSCPPGFYGQTCTYACQGDDDYCKGLLICLPDPYGCSCYTGWYGTYCNLSCPVNQYGPNCAYQCPCSNCNRFTGICDCNDTECYRGIYTRRQLQAQCSSLSSRTSSTTNLVLLIVLPIIGGGLILSIIAVILYWKIIHSKTDDVFYPTTEVLDENL